MIEPCAAMDEFRFELSPQIEKGRYANFSSATDASGRVFMLGYEECKSDYIIDRNSFPHWTLEFVAGGHGYYQEGSQQHRLRHGALFAYGPNIAHCFGNEQERPFRKYFMLSGGRNFPLRWRNAGLLPGQLLQLGNSTPIVSVFDQMLDEGGRSDAHTPQIIASLEAVLLALMSRHRGAARSAQTGSRKVYELAMDILQRDYRNLHSLADLAGRSGYSSEYLCRIFRKYHGESPYQVLLHRKMSAAWLLLRDGAWQVSAVARELGYEDPLHFSRIFRKVMGCAPSSVQART